MLKTPVVDIFAGSGGLGEGFAACSDDRRTFEVMLSIEKDPDACQTLWLRHFFRLFPAGEGGSDYYDYVRGEITRTELLGRHPSEAKLATKRVWNCNLGDAGVSPTETMRRISAVLGNSRRPWVLLGGPPCQAYSVIGRTRMAGMFNPTKPDRKEAWDRYLADHRHELYREYLRILAAQGPSIFIMENVPGLLSARHGPDSASVKVAESRMRAILHDLEDPCRAMAVARPGRFAPRSGYLIYPLVRREGEDQFELFSGAGDAGSPRRFVVRFEEHGVPQARHRLILLGVRRDSLPHAGQGYRPESLRLEPGPTVGEVIGDLPRIRSRLSREPDSTRAWLGDIGEQLELHDMAELAPEIRTNVERFRGSLGECGSSGGRFMPSDQRPKALGDWYTDPELGGVLNHEARAHMRVDLLRYYVFACARKANVSLRIRDLPEWLLPEHRSAEQARQSSHGYFNDRFRVQDEAGWATTITAHICKDGHAFIHPDPAQCRSLTVREAARIQTFPDNYFFEGPRTSQYRQVGNAVPPLAARSIAKLVASILDDVGDS